MSVTSVRCLGFSPFIRAMLSLSNWQYRSNPIAVMCPLCSEPRMLPAPRISRSRMAILNPLPSDEYCLIAPMRFRALCTRLHVPRQQNVRVRLVLVASHPPAQLIQIAQPKPVRAIDDDGIRIRDIESALDDRRAHQHVDIALDEPAHDIFEFVIAHLTVPDVDANLRSFQQRPQPRRHALRCSARGCAGNTPGRRG